MSENYKSILERMRNSLPLDMISVEGTFTGNNLSAVANELARTYSQELDPMLTRAFTATAEGEDLDRIGNEIGLERKAATCAEATVEISGSPGLYDGIIVGAESILFVTDSFQITEDIAVVRAVCQTAGIIGNVPAGFIKEIKTSGVTLETVTNREAASGGYDEEMDDDYRIRIQDKKKNIITGGNRENYRQWAMSVPGVSGAKVIDLYDGPGTVGIYIIGDGRTVPQSLITEIQQYIDFARPCGAGVTVMAAALIQIDISAAVVLEPGAGIDNVKSDFENAFQKYLEGIPFTYGKKTVVSYIRTADLLLQTHGVADVTAITLNGSEESITMEETAFPVSGTITITE